MGVWVQVKYVRYVWVRIRARRYAGTVQYTGTQVLYIQCSLRGRFCSQCLTYTCYYICTTNPKKALIFTVRPPYFCICSYKAPKWRALGDLGALYEQIQK